MHNVVNPRISHPNLTRIRWYSPSKIGGLPSKTCRRRSRARLLRGLRHGQAFQRFLGLNTKDVSFNMVKYVV